MVTIKKVSPGSAFKIGAILTALFWAIFGLIFFLPLVFVSSVGSSSTFSTSSGGSVTSSGFAGFGIAVMCLFYFGGMFFYGIAGGVSMAIYAFLYNLIANWVGGLQIELDGLPALEKAKRSPEDSENTFEF